VAGREGQPQFSIFGVGPDPEVVEQLIDVGFDRVIFALPSEDAVTVLPLVEKYAELAQRFNA
jgi:hypothetical protein